MKSLILITVDCLRADHVGFLGYHRPTTPFLDSLAGESLVFSNAIVAGCPTYYSFPAIMASRHPLALGRDIIGLAPGEPTLATVLKDSGYETAAFIAGNPYLSPRFGYDAGFDTFCDFLDSALPGAEQTSRTGGTNLRKSLNRRLAGACYKVGLESVYNELYFQYCQRASAPPPQSCDELRCYPAADVIVNQAEAWLAGIGDAPFFLWLHFMDPHFPHYPDQQTIRQMGGSTITPARARYLNSLWNRRNLSLDRLRWYRDEIIQLYDAGIRSVDNHIARLIATLREYRLWDNTTLAVTADHGEEFLDHGGYFHSPSKCAEELVRVPLLIRDADLPVGIASSVFSLVHLPPTLLCALNISSPSEFQGSSYWQRLHGGEPWSAAAIVESVPACINPVDRANRVCARMLAVREQRYKLVLDFRQSVELLFDLQADPGEKHALPASAARSTREGLLRHAQLHLATRSRASHSVAHLKASLRDLKSNRATKTAPGVNAASA